MANRHGRFWLPGKVPAIGQWQQLGYYEHLAQKGFEISQLPAGRLYLNVLSFETVSTVFINGTKLAVFKPTEDHHQMTDFDIDLKKLLRQGKNNIAVHSYSKDPPVDQNNQQKRQFIDVGIIELLNNDQW